MERGHRIPAAAFIAVLSKKEWIFLKIHSLSAVPSPTRAGESLTAAQGAAAPEKGRAERQPLPRAAASAVPSPTRAGESLTAAQGAAAPEKGRAERQPLPRAAASAVPSPTRAGSEQPGDAHPYTTYDVRVTHPNFAPVSIRGVTVFEGVRSLQKVDLVPVAALPDGMTEIEYTVGAPEL